MRSKILLIVGSLACALFAGEAVLGAIFPNEYCVWPPNIRHVFHTNPRYVPGVAAPSRFETNSTGLRGDELKESDHYRILAIGGSTTAVAPRTSSTTPSTRKRTQCSCNAAVAAR